MGVRGAREAEPPGERGNEGLMSVDWDGGPGGARGPFGNRDSEFAMGVRGAREAEPPGERRAPRRAPS